MGPETRDYRDFAPRCKIFFDIIFILLGRRHLLV
jgi:hypothetical protein